MNIDRHSIWLADLKPTRGGEINKTRPVVVVSMNERNAALDTVVICPLTTHLHPRWRSRLQILCAGRRSEIAVDQIRAISKGRLRKKLDTLSASAADELHQLISEMYG